MGIVCEATGRSMKDSFIKDLKMAMEEKFWKMLRFMKGPGKLENSTGWESFLQKKNKKRANGKMEFL